MQSVEIVPESSYDEPERFDVRKHGMQAINMHSSDEIANVELHCESSVLSNVIEEFSQCKLREDKKRFFKVFLQLFHP